MIRYIRLVLMACAGLGMGEAQATSTLDLTTFHVSHSEGGNYVPGAGVDFTENVTPSTLTYTANGTTLAADAGPHRQNMPAAWGDFSLTARVQEAFSVGGLGIGIDGIAKDGQVGFASIGFGDGYLGGIYAFGATPVTGGSVTNLNGPLDLRVTYVGDTLSFYYSLDAGSTFNSLYSLTGVSGFDAAPGMRVDPFLDFYAYGPEGGTPTGSASFTILSFDAAGPVPEPAQWTMMLLGFGLVGSAMRRKDARICFA